MKTVTLILPVQKQVEWRDFAFEFLGTVHSEVDLGDDRWQCEEAKILCVSRLGSALGEAQVSPGMQIYVEPSAPAAGALAFTILVSHVATDQLTIEIAEGLRPEYEGQTMPY